MLRQNIWLAALCTALAVVPFPPTFVMQPPPEQLYVTSEWYSGEMDRPFVLKCEAVGNPEPFYTWTKDGEVFRYRRQDSRILQQPRRGSLVFLRPTDEDEGVYQCRATNDLGTTVSTVSVRKAFMDSFADESTHEVQSTEGTPLSLHCEAPSGYPPPVMAWIIVEESGTRRNINSSHITTDPEGTLHFATVKPTDQLEDAVYACSGVLPSVHEYRIGKRAALRVTPRCSVPDSPPMPLYLSQPSLVAVRGQNLRLFCIFGGNPLPEITWTNSGANISSDRILFKNYGKTLEIPRVDFEDEGTYKCRASNGVGDDKLHVMRVSVESAPFWVEVPENKNVVAGETVKFSCLAAGSPEPQLRWYVNGVPIERTAPSPRRTLEGGYLQLEAVVPEDTAVYQCNASNPHGYQFQNFYLNVLSTPMDIEKNAAQT